MEGIACSKGRVRCVGEEWCGGGRARLLVLTMELVLDVLAVAPAESPDGPSMLKTANACSTSTAAVEQVKLPLLTGAPVATETSDCPSSGGIMMRGGGSRKQEDEDDDDCGSPRDPPSASGAAAVPCVVWQQYGRKKREMLSRRLSLFEASSCLSPLSPRASDEASDPRFCLSQSFCFP